MKVSEIFYSIQGESGFAGWPCVFVRLTACNLRCTYCDTEYAFHEGREMSVQEVVAEVAAHPSRLVLVTGGEPLLQRSVHGLFSELLSRGYRVCVETGGHVPIRDVDPRVHRIMDLKCPSSGMMQHNDYANIQDLTPADEVKFVVGDRADFEWACETIRRLDIISHTSGVLFSPVYGRLPYDELARWVLESGLPVRMQLQLHKIIWPDRHRGV